MSDYENKEREARMWMGTEVVTKDEIKHLVAQNSRLRMWLEKFVELSEWLMNDKNKSHHMWAHNVFTMKTLIGLSKDELARRDNP